MPTTANITGPAAFAARFGDSRETLERLETYEALIRRWQKAVNLVAPNTLDHIWHRHFADSAQILALAPPYATRYIDLGSGAGFPGLVMAILLAEKNPAARVTLVESDQRKTAFLREVARCTATTVDILCTRIQTASTQLESNRADVITARALAPLDKLLGLAAPLFGSGTTGLFPKGREARREIDEARKVWDFDHELAPSITDAEAAVVVIRNLRPRTKGSTP